MLLAFLRWLERASGWLHPGDDGELCVAIAEPAAAGQAQARSWGHVPLARISVLHGVL